MDILSNWFTKVVGFFPVIAGAFIMLLGTVAILACALFIHPAIFIVVLALLIYCFLPEKKL